MKSTTNETIFMSLTFALSDFLREMSEVFIICVRHLRITAFLSKNHRCYFLYDLLLVKHVSAQLYSFDTSCNDEQFLAEVFA